MKTNYQRALELMEEAHYADTPAAAAALVAQAQVFATLALADATRDRKSEGVW